MKYVLVSGGVVSGLGKGVTASSIGVILKNCGHRVTSVKIGEPLQTCVDCKFRLALQVSLCGSISVKPATDLPNDLLQTPT